MTTSPYLWRMDSSSVMPCGHRRGIRAKRSQPPGVRSGSTVVKSSTVTDKQRGCLQSQWHGKAVPRVGYGTTKQFARGVSQSEPFLSPFGPALTWQKTLDVAPSSSCPAVHSHHPCHPMSDSRTARADHLRLVRGFGAGGARENESGWGW